MPEYTRPATWEDLKRLAGLLDEVRVEYALAENSRRWILALRQLPDQATRALDREPDVFADDKRYAVRVNDEFTIDVMPSVAGHSWDEMQPYVETIDLDGIPLRVLNLQGLLLTKQGQRPKDQLDASLLRQAPAALNAGKS